MRTIDLNADLGEGAGTDKELLQIVSSASIACGGHAGDVSTIRETLVAANIANVVVGAHPGFADPEYFGRRRLDLPLSEIQKQMAAQLETFQNIANEEGVPVRYVKLHGALANMAAEDEALASGVFSIVKQHDASLAILALDRSAQVHAAEALGLPIMREAYADRAYTSEGMLVSRSEPGAVIEDASRMTEQCLRLAQNGEIITMDGSVIKSLARSICLHGDTPGAVKHAQLIVQSLKDAGISIASPL